LLGVQVHLWKDVWTLIGFIFAAAALSRDLTHPSRAWRVAALLAIAFACAFRHNAISGALPLLLWIGWREIGAWRPLRVAALAVVLTLIALFMAGLPTRDARVRQVHQVWSVVTLWDATAVSLAEERLVFPPLLMQSSLTLEELRGKFADYSNTTVFELGKLRHSLGRPYSEAERSALYALAWQLPSHHSRAYFAHRLRLAELLFGFDRAGLPMHQVLSPGFTQYADNPPVLQPASAARDRVLGWLRQSVATPLFSGWIYLLVAALVALLGMHRRLQHSHAGLAALLALSSLAYALPLALASGSAEFRYLAWPIWASLAAAATLLCAQAQTRAARLGG
jgi:hypothetical protein